MTNLPPKLEAQARKLAQKYDMGTMMPEGDGWAWEFEISEKYLSAMREMAQRTLVWAAKEIEEVGLIGVPFNMRNKVANQLRFLAGQEERDGK